MARAQFDRAEVIDKSMHLFWEKGFNAASMQQVVKATGLKPGSIYLSFGNKEALYKESLENYARMGLSSIRATMDNARSVGEGICTRLENLIQESANGDYCSCFLVKTQLEFGSKQNDLYDFALAKLNEVEALYRSYLEKEYSEAVARRRAASIMLHHFGIRVYGYRRDSIETMRQGVREGLSWLPWPG
ncbi:TetR/AcrR family transcriptional regulator [Maridesulfovibrio frigidus]|uniref:TetR/AcrR family transcriptional regulator n=1 Tax=Maridesulfovibrio frigidus TaxID=340956 RepID=UPI0004E0D9D5|nr:TetR/AcrR family transcriptional regulator [Maridesulfovibrio frigidus]